LFLGRPSPPKFTSPSLNFNSGSYNLTWSTEAFAPVTEYKLRYRQSKVCSTCVQLQPHLVNRGLCSGHRVQTQIQTVQGMQYVYSCNLTWSTEAFAPVTEYKLRYRQSKVCSYTLTWSTEAFAPVTEYKLRYRQSKVCSYNLNWSTEAFAPVTEYKLRYRQYSRYAVTTSPGQLRSLLRSQSTNSDTDSPRYAVHVYCTVATWSIEALLRSQSTNSDTDSPRYAVQVYRCNLTWSTEAFAPVTEYKLRYRQSKVCSACVQLQPHLVNGGLCSGHRVQTQIQTVQGMQFKSTVGTSPGRLAFAPLKEYKLRYRQSKVCSMCTVATSPGQLRPLLRSQSTNSDTDSPRYAVQAHICNHSLQPQLWREF
jgi:hypothetical protein